MELVRTIPDTIDLIKMKLKPFRPIAILDLYYSIIESIGSKMSVYAWQKRWCNRQKGTGYRK
tara:strand:+ start:3349 stop:3534 length:186 start_codon:yes stop_codon:yes gene_type:complete